MQSLRTTALGSTSGYKFPYWLKRAFGAGRAAVRRWRAVLAHPNHQVLRHVSSKPPTRLPMMCTPASGIKDAMRRFAMTSGHP
jgi:hypothetical protein